MRAPRRLCCLPICILVATPVFGSRIAAQAADLRVELRPQVQAEIANFVPFTTLLREIARDGRLTVVVEGVPLKSRIAVERLKAYYNRSKEAEPALAELAAQTDYRVVRRGRVYLFLKRYSDPYDLPGVTLEECRLFLNELDRLLSVFSPAFGRRRSPQETEPWLAGLVDTLTPEQLNAMEGSGLAVRDLTSNQQEAFRRMAMHLYLGMSLDELREARRVLNEHLLKSSTYFSNEKYAGETCFGYTYQRASSRLGTPTPPISYYVHMSPLQGVWRLGNRMQGIDNYALQRLAVDNNPISLADPTAPPPGANAQEQTEGADTIANLVARLNGRSQGEETQKEKIEVDAALAAKPLQIAGEEYASHQDLLNSVAAIYGLRVIKDEKAKMLRLTRLPVPRDATLETLSNALRLATPTPFLRLLGVESPLAWTTVSAPTSAEEGIQEKNTEKKAGPFEADRAIHEAPRRRLAAQMVLRAAAVRKFRTIVAPLMDKDKASGGNGQILISQLSEEDKIPVSSFLVSSFLDMLRMVASEPVPGYVTNYKGSTLGGGRYMENGKPKLKIEVQFLDTQAGQARHWSVYSIDYPR